MGTLIRMKAEVVNPELPVLTEQGILPYYTGVYVNRLAEKGVTLTQTEINAVTAFINSLIEADVIDKIGTFFPFMGNVNVPLIGNRELEFADVTSSNTKLDFVGDKFRGVKGFDTMDKVKLSELADSEFGVMFGGSAISKIPTTTPNNKNFTIISFRDKQYNRSIPSVQLRINHDATTAKFTMYNFYDTVDDSKVAILRYVPTLEASNNLHNYSFAYGLTSVAPPYSTGFLQYSRALNRDGALVSNETGNDSSIYIHSENIGGFTIFLNQANTEWGSVLTTLALFNEILNNTESRAFINALDTFTAAVGKTVSVG